MPLSGLFITYIGYEFPFYFYGKLFNSIALFAEEEEDSLSWHLTENQLLGGLIRRKYSYCYEY